MLLSWNVRFLSFEWNITPVEPEVIVNHCSFVGDSNPFSESPIVTFNEPGIYTITLTVTNGICEAQSYEYEFTVQGTPGVTLNASGDDVEVCRDDISNSNPFIVDFETLYSPQYTAEPFAPSSYNWVVSGDGISESDYSLLTLQPVLVNFRSSNFIF